MTDLQSGIASALVTATHVGFAGDWHADPNAAVQSFDQARQLGAEVVIQVGDIVFTGERFHRMLRTIEVAVQRTGVPLIFIRGNQDDPGMLAALPPELGTPFRRAADGVFYAPNGSTWVTGGRTFAALGGAATPDRAIRTEGVDWWEAELPIMSDVRAIVSQAPRLDVLVAHDAPITEALAARQRAHGGVWDGGYAEQSSRFITNAMWATAPELLVAGHLHLRHSEVIRRMAASTRLEVLDQGDGHGMGALVDNMMIVDLRDKLLP